LIYSELFSLSIPYLSHIYFQSNSKHYSRIATVQYLLYWLPVILSLFIFIFAIFYLYNSVKRRYPIVTLIISLLSSLLYVFVGLGWEALFSIYLFPYDYLIVFLSSIFHSSYEHITGNMPYFVINSTILEAWVIKDNIKNRAEYIKKYTFFYAIPLFLNNIIEIPLYYYGMGFSVGLSGVIIIFSILLLFHSSCLKKYVENQNSNITEKDIVALVFTGIGFGLLYGWLMHPIKHSKYFIYVQDYNGFILHMYCVMIGIFIVILVYYTYYKSILEMPSKNIYKNKRDSLEIKDY